MLGINIAIVVFAIMIFILCLVCLKTLNMVLDLQVEVAKQKERINAKF